MIQKTITESDQALVKNDRTIPTTTLGYACTAILFWMIGLLFTGWTFGAGAGFEIGFLYGLGGIMLAIIGILSLLYGRSLDTIVFLGLSGLFLCVSMGLIFVSFRTGHWGPFAASVPPAAQTPEMTLQPAAGFLGWFAVCWTVFFCYVWISSFKAGFLRILFLLFLWLAILSEALGAWTSSMSLVVLGGYLLMISSVFAFILSAAEVISFSPGKLMRRKVISHNTVTIEDSHHPEVGES